MLGNGITAGGLVAIFMTLFLEVTAPRRRRIEAALDLAALPKIREFLGAFASRSGWGETMVDRLDAASEETLLTLVGQDEDREERARRRLLLRARKEAGGAVLEFIAAAGEENLQDRMGLLAESPDDVLMEREVSLRLLRHIASSVRHQQFSRRGHRDRARGGPGAGPWAPLKPGGRTGCACWRGRAAFARRPRRAAGRAGAGGAPRPRRLRLGPRVVGDSAGALGCHQLPCRSCSCPSAG